MSLLWWFVLILTGSDSLYLAKSTDSSSLSTIDSQESESPAIMSSLVTCTPPSEVMLASTQLVFIKRIIKFLKKSKCLNYLDDWVCTTRCNQILDATNRQCSLIVFAPVARHIVEQLKCSQVPCSHRSIMTTRHKQVLALHLQTWNWIGMSYHCLYQFIGVYVNKAQFVVLCSCDEHRVTCGNFVDLCCWEVFLRSVMALLDTYFLKLVPSLSIEKSDSLLCIANCEIVWLW